MPHYLMPPFHYFTEYRADRWHYGIYFTGAASVLQAAMFGFTGIRAWSTEKGRDTQPTPPNPKRYLEDRKASLPLGWQFLRIGRIYLDGACYSVEVQHKQQAVLKDVPCEV
jgi:hypothetical protein